MIFVVLMANSSASSNNNNGKYKLSGWKNERQQRCLLNWWRNLTFESSEGQQGRSGSAKKAPLAPLAPLAQPQPPSKDIKFRVKDPLPGLVASSLSSRPTKASEFLQLALANLQKRLKQLNEQKQLKEDTKQLSVISCSECQSSCGLANEQGAFRGGRIINGSLVEPHQFPW